MDTQATHKFSNSLIHETSPYLLQHAHNPVDWYAWNETALAKARLENKPILLSIGYSACHWCHVMEHESFEDESVAQVMNQLFVCVKVDREERPDLDKIYQMAHQMLMQRPGGWPLNIFLTPDDHTPFFGGTYFPRQAKYGMPAFSDVLQRIASFYHEQRNDIARQNASIREAFQRIEGGNGAPGSFEIQRNVLDGARKQLEEQFDAVYGGFGGAPKFPHPTNIERCLRYWAESVRLNKPDLKAYEMTRRTLYMMAQGGIYDQLGGGFYRYSVDAYWIIPHFEKMLYDNGPLLTLYADMALASGEELYQRVALETGDWVRREMQAPAGGYYSTLDADSEGHEGKFYVWPPEEIKTLVTQAEFNILAPLYGLDHAPNFEGKEWHLHVYQPLVAVAETQNLTFSEARQLLTSAHKTLFNARAKRIRPARDEKILTSWNGLMIKGMARAGRFFNCEDFIQSAQSALDFIHTNLWQNGRLLATAKGGKARLNAYLDDYVFLIDGVLELLQTRWRDQDLTFALALTEVMLSHFADTTHGGFYFTSDDHEKLIHRPKPGTDEATPAGNGIAVQILLRLGHLLGEVRYLNAAELTIKAFYREIAQYPSAHNSLLTAIEEYLQPAQIIILRGSESATAPWLLRCQRHYSPTRLVLAIPESAHLPPTLALRSPPATGVIAYLCQGHTCAPPITDIEDFSELLKSSDIKAVSNNPA